MNYSSHKMKSIEDMVRSYADKVNNCSGNQEQFRIGRSGTRMLLRANGDVYSCMGFTHVFRLGNMYENSFAQILENANNNRQLRAVFSGGLPQLLDYAKKLDPDIGNRLVSVLNGPCNICKVLSASL